MRGENRRVKYVALVSLNINLMQKSSTQYRLMGLHSEGSCYAFIISKFFDFFWNVQR